MAPVRVALRAQGIAGNLPATLNSFVGREQEVADARALLATGSTRLLTLTGAGGVGKTRLAIEVASALLEAGTFADGVWLAELASLADRGAVAQAVAAVLHLQEEPERGFFEVLLDALSSRHVLLVLDNCEHLVDACAALAYCILRSCPRVTILATSREPLGVDGEIIRRVPSLSRPDPNSLPELDELRAFAAIRLFLDRGAAAASDFQVTRDNAVAVAQVCDRLDGIPLALELAAARVRALSVAQIAERLDDRFSLLDGGSRSAPPRQQTLEAAVSWSYDLLHDDEQRLLRRLAVFAGGWSLDDAEAVSSDGESILPALARLVEKSLVSAEHGPSGRRWYRLLETIRQFALRRLQATDEVQSIRERHFHHYVELAEQFDRETRWTRDLTWHRRLDWVGRMRWEYPNLRLAWQWARAVDDDIALDGGLRIAAALYAFFYTLGYLSDAREWFATLLARDAERPPSRARARALSVAAKIAVHHGRDEDTRALASEYVSLPDALKEPPVTALVMNALGVVALRERELPAARRYVMEAVRLARIAPEAGVSLYLPYLAAVAEAEGDLTEAERVYQLAVDEGRADDFLLSVAFGLAGLARLAHARGDRVRARALYEAGLPVMSEFPGMPQVALTVVAIGYLSLEKGDFQRARDLFREALEIAARIGQREALVVSLEACATLLAARTPTQPAALRLRGITQYLREATRLPPAAPEHSRTLAAAHRTVGEPGATLLIAEGRGMQLDEATALARTSLATVSEADGVGTPLTAREREVAVLLARGYSNREVAEALVVGKRTAEMHVTNLLNKLGLSSRSQVAVWAVQNGLLTETP